MKDNRKYRLSDDPGDRIEFQGHTLRRIVALKEIVHDAGQKERITVSKGDKGGYVETEDNLSHTGTCWIYNDAKVMDDASVNDDARVFDIAVVKGMAIVGGKALIADSALIEGNTLISGGCIINGCTHVSGWVNIFTDKPNRHTNTAITGNVRILARIVSENARITGPSPDSFRTLYLNRDGEFGPGSVIRDPFDYFSSYNQWSSNRLITYMRNTGLWCTGCFIGTGRELIAKAYEDSYMKGECFRKLVRYAEDVCRIRKSAPEFPTNPWQAVKMFLFGYLRGKKKR